MKRSIVIEHNNGEPDIELELGKASIAKTDSEFIYLEKMPSGKWNLTFSESIVKDFSTVKSLNVYRED